MQWFGIISLAQALFEREVLDHSDVLRIVAYGQASAGAKLPR